jgi:Protein of unknown function (DUF4058)
MPSPFPGMDPYLEDPTVWEEFHHVFITECMYFLSDRLPNSYLAKINERVELVSRSDAAAAQYVPDVAMMRERPPRQRQESEPTRPAGGVAVATAPVTIPSVESLEVREGYIEIQRLPDYELVTSIELLSPWNKYGEGLGEYRHKRRSLVSRGVHVVEIDLLRRGRRTELARPLPAGHYYAFAFRADRRPDVDVYAWDLRHPLPTVSVPLQAPDPDVSLELRGVVNSAFDRGRYARKLRYSSAPPEPLSAEDSAWVSEIVRSVAADGRP